MAWWDDVEGLFAETVALVKLPDNDFTYSCWEDSSEAVAELEQAIAQARTGQTHAMSGLTWFFLPAGPLQETALSSGWGDAFLGLADRADALGDCPCQIDANRIQPVVADLGLDRNLGEVSLRRCDTCGLLWLHYLFEQEAFTGSGRWFKCPAQSSDISAEQGLRLLREAPWVFYGGSAFDGRTGRMRGKDVTL